MKEEIITNMNETGDYELLSDKQIKAFVSRYPWTYAKSYAAFAPHEYYVKYNMDLKGQEYFERFINHIRVKGFEACFGRNVPKNHHIYFEFEGKYYWTMGAPIKETFILNRCDSDLYIVANGYMIHKREKK